MDEIKIRRIIAEALEQAAVSLRASGDPDSMPPRGEPKSSTSEGADNPSRTFADFYVCGAPALAKWRDRVGRDVSVFKMGLTRQGVATRQADLREDEYAGYVRAGDGYRREVGFNGWEMRRLAPIALDPAQSAAVAFVPRAIRLRLGSRAFDAVERNIRLLLRPWALETWAAAPKNRARLADAGIDPCRYTAARFGDETVYKRSNELYVIRPRVDLPKIVAALAAAVA